LAGALNHKPAKIVKRKGVRPSRKRGARIDSFAASPYSRPLWKHPGSRDAVRVSAATPQR